MRASFDAVDVLSGGNTGKMVVFAIGCLSAYCEILTFRGFAIRPLSRGDCYRFASRLLSFRVAIAISWCGRNRGGTPETCQNGHANRSKPLHDAVAEASWRRRWCRATAILSLVGWVGKVPIMMNNVNTKAVDGRAEAAFRVWCGPPVARAGGPVSHRLSTAKKIRLIICACRNNDLSLPCYPPLAPRPCLTAGTMRAKPFNPKQSLSRR